MKFKFSNWDLRFLGLCVTVAIALGSAATRTAGQIASDQKAKVKGTIVSRNGDLVTVRDKNSGTKTVVDITDNTTIERKHGKVEFFRHSDMDVTAMVPGLTIEAEGVGNAKGQLVAKKISFTPDEFAVEVAEEQQIQANQTAAARAQTTANQGVHAAKVAQTSANNAQTSANTAQTSANNAQATADAAGAGALMDADAITMVNERVSDLDSYKTVAEAVIYFPSDGSTLDDAAKADLATLAAYTNGGLQGYMVEIAGYASSSGTKQLDQQLSEDRAANVAKYLRDTQNVPLRRILIPAGYGATHPDATNRDPQGRALNRRVDVKVIVNKGINEGT
ncbi:MAG TPA: OmpA family protein [Candidatus Sulfotelmatobacter sp.]|nr:OmpA family protein [Candidatus Sulfotelmatobacter sp.]